MSKSTRHNQRGFTLMEIMIALVLISLVVVSVIQLSTANLRSLSKSDDYVELMARASAKTRDVLELEKLEEKSWTETDSGGYAYEIAVTEIEKERSDALTVRLMQITVKTFPAGKQSARAVTMKTAKLSPKSDVLGGGGKDAAPEGYVD